eukprot:TRINITY_DN1176_c0_g1_i1.p1 TRINITY_DN1176_c0_g1~~TRINITY_DN1176_c0_g1_i1.p1  ORF type:complete len:234 (+),score=77.62 TRINITY_DN1176_c0_g1_i1:104-805(+)
MQTRSSWCSRLSTMSLFLRFSFLLLLSSSIFLFLLPTLQEWFLSHIALSLCSSYIYPSSALFPSSPSSSTLSLSSPPSISYSSPSSLPTRLPSQSYLSSFSLSSTSITTPFEQDALLFVPTTYTHDPSFPLSSSSSSSLPTTVHSSVPLILSSIAGGCTSYQTFGYWIDSSTNQLVSEPITVYSVFVRLTNEIKNELYEMAEWLARELRQRVILLKLDRQTLLIPPRRSYLQW